MSRWSIPFSRQIRSLLDEELLGFTGDETAPEKELTVEDLLLVPPGSDQTAAAYYGMRDTKAEPDEVDSYHLATEWSASPTEAAMLVGYLRERTIGIVRTDRFMQRIGMIAAVLLRDGALDGRLATHLLDRQSAIDETKEAV